MYYILVNIALLKNIYKEIKFSTESRDVFQRIFFCFAWMPLLQKVDLIQSDYPTLADRGRRKARGRKRGSPGLFQFSFSSKPLLAVLFCCPCSDCLYLTVLSSLSCFLSCIIPIPHGWLGPPFSLVLANARVGARDSPYKLQNLLIFRPKVYVPRTFHPLFN